MTEKRTIRPTSGADAIDVSEGPRYFPDMFGSVLMSIQSGDDVINITLNTSEAKGLSIQLMEAIRQCALTDERWKLS